MIKPRDGEMNYKNLQELAFYYMFVSACLTEDEADKLKEEWEKQGGYNAIPWWEFVMKNTKVELSIE